MGIHFHIELIENISSSHYHLGIVIMKVAILIAIVCCSVATAVPVEENVAVQQFKSIVLGVGAPAAPGSHQCSPDFYCVDNTVCCQYDGEFKMCCPVSASVCCPDQVHCCPVGTYCNNGMCYYK